jgi:hypothetical protein
MNARTRLAYEHAGALNIPPQPPSAACPDVSPLPRTPATVQQSASPVRNPYYPSLQQRPSLRQTTIPETVGCGRGSGIPNPIGMATGFRGGDRSILEGRDRSSSLPPPIDTAAGIRGRDRGDRPFVGGSVISPRTRDRDLHTHTLGASRFDVIKLACSEYHVGMDGVPMLTEDILAAQGFAQALANVEDVVVCYNDIILAHRKIMELWYNSYAHTSGPQIDKIIQKSLSVFPHLESTKVVDAVNFYDRLQEVGLSYVIAILPFDAIILPHGFEGLCPPGLGLV